MNTKIIKGGLSYFNSLIQSKHRPIPLYVNIFYTRRCNLRCDFCAAIKNPAKTGLTLDQWKECSDILFSLGNRFISITGGEPIIRRDLPAFINYLSKKSRLHSVISNGRLLNEDRLRELAEAGLMHLGVSTQSLIPGKHVKSQNRELFEMILKYKKKYRFEVSALITLTSDNVEEVPDIVRFLGQKGINVAPNIVTSGQGSWWFRNYCPTLQFNKTNFHKLKKTIDYLSRAKNVIYSLSF
ncbi:MAG: Radical SAM domain protein [Microgenomates group bacterium GW2011_GWA2_44_7]|nr:MAG: Radical SAM domain protein [Microgenomates group bacterium GW2011_GWA2_44_7]